MKVGADALGNLAYRALMDGEDDLGRAGYDEGPNESQARACDEAMVCVEITKALALRQKRIVIDVVYPKAKG